MGKGTLTIYSASAGSGKTYTLTGNYLTSLFRSRYSYRRILAVTFTNKATAEMKSRILDHLDKLAKGESSVYLPGLIKTINKSEDWIRNEAREILNSILHDFSRFSVTTIDSFFQKILRAFTREIGLHSGFNIELDHSVTLSSAVDEMIASSSDDPQLKEWLAKYVRSNIEAEKSWNLKEGIIRLSEELFKENFKILSADEQSNLKNKKFLLNYIEKIKSVSSSFEKQLRDYGKRASEIFSKYELSDDMFYYKGKGVPGFIKSLASGAGKAPNNYVREIGNDPPRWSTGTSVPQLQSAINDGLDDALIEAINYYDENIVMYKSAVAVISHIYALGILSDVLHHVHLITNSENNFLLSDAGELLNLITREDQSPFIYEKAGNRFENFMIDEFQDTSKIQWKNFQPLIENSMAEGFDNLVVGDVKQSIYRWRNSDWKILGSELKGIVDGDRIISKPLTTNWRSRSNIIKFNNTLFTIIPEQVDEVLNGELLPVSFKKLYSEAKQLDPGKKKGGYIRLEFIEDSREIRWQTSVLDRLPGIIETVQDKGFNASDIGIIVRDGREGAQVLKTLADYSNNCSSERKKLYNYNVVSNDSLLLSNSPVIIFIISVISVVIDPADMINRALMLRSFQLARGIGEAEKVPIISENLIKGSRLYFPEGYEAFLESVGQMSIFEATESIIRFFKLGDYSWNVAYLNTFQDHIISFTGSKSPDFQSFLDWWETTGCRKSVVLPGSQDAIRILTIHKSKGLEFKVVILPFLSWNLDHRSFQQPVLWIKPTVAPFNNLGVVPVKYNRELSNTIFAEYYQDEKYSAYIDNINLLYVAFTRAKEAIYGFSIENPRSENTIAVVLKNAIIKNTTREALQANGLSGLYNDEMHIFEFGEIPENTGEKSEYVPITSSGYNVSNELECLKLRLHGENYFSSDKKEVQRKINYGKLMHEIFEGINTPADISYAVRKLVLEGKLPAEEGPAIEERINLLVDNPQVAEWFLPGNEVMREVGILMPSGHVRRPDRVILKEGKAIIIDFKFGEENPRYARQVDQYRSLLADMGFDSIEAYLWYVDKNLIKSA